MKHLAWLIIVVLIGTGAYWLGKQPPTNTPSEQHNPATTTTDQRKILYYRNPMGLADTSPVPKKDSMGMDYIAVYEGDAGNDSGTVSVSPARLQTLGVKTTKATLRPLESEVRAVGQVVVNERAIYDIAPRFDGWIENLQVSANGDPVKRGQLLFQAYSPELVSAHKELAIARQLRQNSQAADSDAQAAAQRLIHAGEQRLKNWQVSPVPDNGRIPFSSPVNGIVLEKSAVAGARFMAGSVLFKIADLSTVWIMADIYEKDLSQIKVGASAHVIIDALGSKPLEARIDYIYPTLNANTRTTPVRLLLSNPQGHLRPGMFAHVELDTSGSKPRLTVPKSAVIDSGAEQVVLLALGGGKFKPQQVQTGLRDRHDIEILSGLKVGDEVVISANFMIDAESNLKSALANFTEPTAHAKTFEAQGKLESISLNDNTVSISHEAISALEWPAMTMDFSFKPTGLFEGKLPGDRIKFTFEDHGNGEYVIVKVEKTVKHSGH